MVLILKEIKWHVTTYLWFILQNINKIHLCNINHKFFFFFKYKGKVLQWHSRKILFFFLECLLFWTMIPNNGCLQFQILSNKSSLRPIPKDLDLGPFPFEKACIKVGPIIGTPRPNHTTEKCIGISFMYKLFQFLTTFFLFFLSKKKNKYNARRWCI